MLATAPRSLPDLSPRPGDLEPIETASRDEIAGLQLNAAPRVPELAGVPRKFDAAGVHPDDCRSLADLAKFPFTTKKDLRDSYPFGMFAVPREQCARIHASSGTTGKPTVVGYTQGHRHLGRRDGALDPRQRRPPGMIWCT
jgi:phenylacetate-CoA ligase